jgi:hypothetical protein
LLYTLPERNRVFLYSDGELRVTLKGLFHTIDEFKQAVALFFSENEYRFDPERPLFIILHHVTEKTLAQLHHFLVHLDNTLEPGKITKSLLSEIEEISEFLFKKQEDKIYHHNIPVFEDGIRFSNPNRAGSTELINLVSRYDDCYTFPLDERKKLKKLLVQGEDVNQHVDGTTPMYHAVIGPDTDEVFFLLLCYGADPFVRNNLEMGWFGSAWDIILMRKLSKKADMVISMFTNPKKSPSAPKQLQSKVSFHNNRLSTIFCYQEDRPLVTTVISSIKHLKAEELSEVYTLFKKGFSTPLSIFKKDFSGEDKLIECIFSSNQLIGFILYQKIKENDCIVFASLYGYITPEQRKSGLILLLSTRLAFALQLLNREANIAIFFSALNYQSYRLIQDLPHFPKYDPGQDQQSKPLSIKNILKKIYGNYELYQEEMTCYIIDDVETDSEQKVSQKPNQSLLEIFFQQYILGYHPKQDTNALPKRGAPIFYFVTLENFLLLSKTLHTSLGLFFFQHLIDVASHMHPLVSDLCQNQEIEQGNKMVTMSKNDHLFWNRERVYEQQGIKTPMFHITSRL